MSYLTLTCPPTSIIKESLVLQFEMMNTRFDLMEERIIGYEMQLGALTLWMGRMDARISRLQWNQQRHIPDI